MIEIGNKYANWKVIKLSQIKNKKRLYLCECNCGFKKEVRDDELKKANSQFCRKCIHKDKEIKKGDKFGSWTVLREVESEEKRKHYEVQCDCGDIRILKGIRLRFGDSNKCRKCGSTRHGLVHSKTYSTWESMIQRCNNPKQTKYKDYGGRGIKVCDRWTEFKNFLEDMGERPDKLELDRKDNNGNYEPSNCRWTTRSENLKNRRSRNLKDL